MTTLVRRLTLGTRGSALARWQTDDVIRQLQSAWPELECRTHLITTSGDRILDRPLPEIGGKGLFTEELESALRSGEIDLAVHSLKDVPIGNAPGLTLGAICARGDARDALISRHGWTLDTLPPGARVGTCSLRRSAQLLAARPDLTLLPLRGNVDTRLRLAAQGDYDAIVLAAAGVLRLGLGAHITEFLPLDVMLPAPGQGAMAVQCRAGDAARELVAAIDHAASRAAVAAERAFLQGLGGGCSAPVAAYAQSQISNTQFQISMRGLAASTDGRRVIRVRGNGADPLWLGAELARKALAQGAGELLQ
jgi:hydroxymethylbilane synthase